MKIEINNINYDVELDHNLTTNDILKNLPLQLHLSRYANHEYYSELPFKPNFDKTRTSKIKAGHLYYWDGWNAFVINYEDYDITPYKVVHIGKILDTNIIDILKSANKEITIEVTNRKDLENERRKI